MKKYIFLFLIMSHVGQASFLITKFNNFFKINISQQESLIVKFPVELLIEISKYLNNKEKQNLGLLGHKFDSYREIINKMLHRNIGKNIAEIDLPILGFFSAFSDEFYLSFNKNDELFNNNNSIESRELMYNAYKSNVEDRYINACIRFSEVFLPNRSEIMQSKIALDNIKKIGIQEINEEFAFNLNGENKNLLLKIFSLQDNPRVVVIPKASEVILSIGDLEVFLKQLVNKYDKTKRIIVDDFKNKDEEVKIRLGLFEEIANILKKNNIIIQNKNGYTLFYKLFSRYPFSQNSINKLENICQQYPNFIKTNFKARDKEGYTMFDSICVQGYYAGWGTLKFIESLLEENVVCTDDVDLYGRTPLHNVIKSDVCLGKEEKINLLIKYGANVNTKDKYGNTPLHYCKDNNVNDLEYAKILLKNGANFCSNKKGEKPKIEPKCTITSSLFWDQEDTFSF